MIEYKRNNVSKSMNIVVWASDFQINRLRLSNHWYVDGVFTVVPIGYHQLLTICIRDPNTGFVKPALWGLLSSKEEDCYMELFRIIKNLITSLSTVKCELSNVTLDFEPGLMNGFAVVFPDVRIIGCLFHFKQALFREAQQQRLTTQERMDKTKEIISLLGSLCWNGDIKLVQKKFNEMERIEEDSEYIGLIEYYKKNWLPRLKSGLIDYSNTEDNFRSNSVIEQYNAHIKNSLTRSSSWPKFVNFLVDEESKYVQSSFNAEQKGESAVKSINFGKASIPQNLPKRKAVIGTKKSLKEPTTLQANKGKGKSTKKRKIESTENIQLENSADNTTSHKHVLKSTKKNSRVSKNPKIKKYTFTSGIKVKGEVEEVAERESVDESQSHDWIEWDSNSCRYDSFLTVFALCLYNKDQTFHVDKADRRHRLYKQYERLCSTADALLKATTMQERKDIISEFWMDTHAIGVDEQPLGVMGSVNQLLQLLSPLLSLRPFLIVHKNCQFCDFEGSERIRWYLPISITDMSHLNFGSLQEYYTWFLETKKSQQCEVCKLNTLTIRFGEGFTEPDYITIEFIYTNKKDEIELPHKFTFNENLKGKDSKFKLVSTINRPTANHFSCCLYRPRLLSKDFVVDNWVWHDGLKHQRKLVAMRSFSEVSSQKPMILFYEKAKTRE